MSADGQSTLLPEESTTGHSVTETETALRQRYPGYRDADEDYRHAGSAAIERWMDWKFGLRIHWGPYSILGNGPESWPLGRPFTSRDDSAFEATATLRRQYEKVPSWWNPINFNAEDWVQMMTDAGMRYFTFTAKHHDGFSMYDTATRVRRRIIHTGEDAGRIVDCDLAYSIMETPFRRDVLGELINAARRQSLGVGVYFSHIDWFDSDFRIDTWNYQQDPHYTRATDPEGFARLILRHRDQLVELCSNYGELDLLSLDMNFPEDGREHQIHDDIVQTVKTIRRLQPGMLMRNRGIGPYGDYFTPEREVPGVIPGSNSDHSDAARIDTPMPWQVIYPGSRHFSHVWGDEYKPVSWILQTLVDVVAKGGNFQVGYGPGPDGSFDDEVLDRLQRVGRWLQVNGEAIYGTRPYRTYHEGPHVRFTQSKDQAVVYAFVMDWPHSVFDPSRVRLRSVRVRPGSTVTMLGNALSLEYLQDKDQLEIFIPEQWRPGSLHQDFDVAVFRLEPDLQSPEQG